MNDCPPVERLRHLLAEQLNDTDRDEVEAHVEGCAACQQVLEELAGAFAGEGAGQGPGAEGSSGHEPRSPFWHRLALSKPSGGGQQHQVVSQHP
jgi:Putative zinc-finger